MIRLPDAFDNTWIGERINPTDGRILTESLTANILLKLTTTLLSLLYFSLIVSVLIPP